MTPIEFGLDVAAFMIGLAVYDWLKSRSGRRPGARVCETPDSDPRTDETGQQEIWIDQYDLNLGVEGGPEETLDDVREHFDELLADAIERDPKLGPGDVEPDRGVE